ncbi:MAG TPA: cellulase family glycosylhydrolase [Roseiflexaceae bacterium]|nr:cellulase family glycosylhydrolase [Roseiflexaceae bacterium]
MRRPPWPALALAAGLLATFLYPAPARSAPRCFPEAGPAIGDCIDGRIRAFWEAQGGLPVFGYPLGPAFEQQTAVGPIAVQLFERARLEHHPRNAPPYDILLGRLGADALSARGEGIAPPEPPRDGCRFFSETDQNVCGAFLAAYRRYGLELGHPGVSADESLALFGLPLTPPRQEVLSDGRAYTVQWFERARFEDHGPAGVLFGLLGRELLSVGALQTSPAPPTDRGGFIRAEGTQLTRLGRPVQLKGVNYYPQGRPWGEMWYLWDGPQVERELRLARDQLGINTVRVLMPYEVSNSESRRGKVTPEMLGWLRQMVQIAGELDMRVIVTLFDFFEDFPAPGTREEEENLTYLRTVVGNFIGDDRIIAWDLHNEPDHYRMWRVEGRVQHVLGWLGRMADEVHRLDPNHLVTVGMGNYQNLLVRGPDGRRPIDYSDLISLHNYNAADTARQVDELRAASGKPVLLGEFGWPTGPRCMVAGYTEAQQASVYREALAQAQGRVAGVLAWTLRDFDVGPSRRWDTREEHYGMYRADGSLKPAAEFLRAYPAEPLPAQLSTDLPLTSYGPNVQGGMHAPLLIPEAGVHVKGLFRRAWALLGGRGTFGLPLAEAYTYVDEKGREQVVQYFEHAVLALDREADNKPGFHELTEVEQIKRQVVARVRGEQAGRRAFEAQCQAVGQ